MGPDSESPVTVRNSDLDFGFTAGPRRDSEWRATRAPASLSIMIMVRAEAAATAPLRLTLNAAL